MKNYRKNSVSLLLLAKQTGSDDEHIREQLTTMITRKCFVIPNYIFESR